MFLSDILADTDGKVYIEGCYLLSELKGQVYQSQRGGAYRCEERPKYWELINRVNELGTTKVKVNVCDLRTKDGIRPNYVITSLIDDVMSVVITEDPFYCAGYDRVNLTRDPYGNWLRKHLIVTDEEAKKWKALNIKDCVVPIITVSDVLGVRTLMDYQGEKIYFGYHSYFVINGTNKLECYYKESDAAQKELYRLLTKLSEGDYWDHIAIDNKINDVKQNSKLVMTSLSSNKICLSWMTGDELLSKYLICRKNMDFMDFEFVSYYPTWECKKNKIDGLYNVNFHLGDINEKSI